MPDKPTVTRKGGVVTMPVAVFDDLLARLLLAEQTVAARNAEDEQEIRRLSGRSWWKPGGAA